MRKLLFDTVNNTVAHEWENVYFVYLTSVLILSLSLTHGLIYSHCPIVKVTQLTVSIDAATIDASTAKICVSQNDASIIQVFRGASLSLAPFVSC